MRFPQLVSSCVIFSLVTLWGCTTLAIPNEELNQFALLVPQDIYGNGAAVTQVETSQKRTRLQLTSEGSHILPGTATRPGVNVPSGRHTVQVTTCHTSSTFSCHPDTYVFDAQAGMAYVLGRSNERIAIIDRFTKISRGYLYPAGGNEFITEEQFATKQQRVAEATINIGREIIERRRRDQPLIRKVGAHVCKEYGRGVIYSGYVEGITEDKVRINISNAYYKGSPELSPKEFRSSTIWESPMQWDLCD
jgi:hypothetical protein